MQRENEWMMGIVRYWGWAVRFVEVEDGWSNDVLQAGLRLGYWLIQNDGHVQ